MRVISFGLAGMLCCLQAVLAAVDSAPAVPGTPQERGSATPMDVPGCPDQGGILDSVSVQVGEPLELAVVIGQPAPEGGVVFELSSGDPSVVAAGDPLQGFLPRVFIPEGGTVSNTFTVFGIEVGETFLQAASEHPDFNGFSVPLGAWDVGDHNTDKFLDANPPDSHCRVAADSPELSTDETVLADCGARVQGAVTDGVTRLLMRMQSGLPGTACFEIVSTGEHDGEIETALKSTQPAAGFEQASSYYRVPDTYGDDSASRSVEVEFTFTPAIGNGNTTRFSAELELVRPPVALVHGLWSNGGAWDDFWIRNDADYTSFVGDYAATNDSAFAVNVPNVRDFVEEAITNSRQKGYATTQADVIGHSMGGILTRLYAQDAEFERPENLGEGDVRRLITLGTPHRGSSFANLVVALHDAEPEQTRETISNLIPSEGADPGNGAVCDLAENSPAVMALAGGTDLPAHVVAGTGGPAGTPSDPAPYWQGATIFNINSFEAGLTETECVRRGPMFSCLEREPVFPQDIVDGHRFRQANDAIVALSSAAAAIPAGNAARAEFDLIHFGAPFVAGLTNRAVVADHALPLIDQSTDEPVWAAQYPAFPGTPPVDGSGTPWTVPGIPGGDAPDMQAYAAQCGPGGPLSTGGADTRSATRVADGLAADPRVQIVEPGDGTVFAPGDSVSVTVEVDASLSVTDAKLLLEGLGRLDMSSDDGLVFTGEFVIPDAFAGPITLAPRSLTEAGERVLGPSTTIASVPMETPEEIYLTQAHHRLDAVTGETVPLRLKGRYADGQVRNLTHAVTGTTYTSSDPAVVTVDANGRISTQSEGTAVVTVEHRGLTEFATIQALSGDVLPPADVTSRLEVRRGGLRLNRNTGFYVQSVEIVNNSPVPVVGPLHALVTGLPHDVRLVNRDSETRNLAPLGTPYLTIPLETDGLNLYPGEGMQVTFEFLNPNRRTINYQIQVQQTSLDP